MKKFFALWILTALLAVSLVAALPAAAQSGSVDRVYSAWDMFDSFSQRFNRVADEYFFENGLWTVEYFDRSAGKFLPMTAYYYTVPDNSTNGAWGNFFTVNESAAISQTDYTYCSISSLARMHPSAQADSTLTFIVPVDGVISYAASVHAYGTRNTAQALPQGCGTELSLWLNDTKIWPTDADRRVLTSDQEPCDLKAEGISVKAGDRLRLTVGAHNGEWTGKGVDLASVPVVTYTSSSAPLRDGVSGIPEEAWILQKNQPSASVSWYAVDNAVGYNVYLGDVKQNDAPETDLTYAFGRALTDSDGSVTVAAVGPDGKEGPRSAPAQPRGLFDFSVEGYTREYSSAGITYRVGRHTYDETGEILYAEPLPSTESSTVVSSEPLVTDSVDPELSVDASDSIVSSSDPEPVTQTDGPAATGTVEMGILDPGLHQGGGAPAVGQGEVEPDSSAPVLQIVLGVGAVLAIGATVFFFLRDRKRSSGKTK